MFFSQDRITDLQAQTQHFAEVGHFDADSLQDKSQVITVRYEKYVLLALKKFLCTQLDNFIHKFAWHRIFRLYCMEISINQLNDMWSLFRVKDLASERRNKLEESNSLQQFYRDVDDEESWIKYVKHFHYY